MATEPPKKRTSAKSPAKKKAASRKRVAAKKSPAKKATGKKAKTSSREAETLHNVARTIGATLGSFAKTTGDALKAAKQVLPNLKKDPE